MTLEEFDEKPDTIPAEYLCTQCGKNEGVLVDQHGGLICEDCE